MAQKSKAVLKTYFETGKRPTQAQFGDLIDSLADERPFKVYVALLNQTGTSHPTAKILENNTGEDFFWVRESFGVYKVLLPSNYSLDNIFVTINQQFKNNSIKVAATMVASTLSGNYLYIKGINDDLLYNTGIEIRFYTASQIETTAIDSALSRYWPYFKKNELRRDGNLLLPPYLMYNSYNGAKGGSDNMNNVNCMNIWRSMTDEYIILPEIYDGKKNPHAFNLITKKFSCAYTYKNSSNAGSYLKDCIKQARKSGARECIIDLGNDTDSINQNIIQLKQVLVDLKADRGMQRVTLITNGQINHYTIFDLMA